MGGRIERVVRIRPAAEAFAENDMEMAAGMLAVPPEERAAEVDGLRIRLGCIKGRRGRIGRMARVVRLVRRRDVRAG